MANLLNAKALFPPRPITKTSSFEHCWASSSSPPPPKEKPVVKRKKSVESTDWIASSLTRRFGIGAGLGWAGFLAFGVVSEQIKTRIEVSQEEANTRDVEEEKETVLPNGIRYYDLRLGGGATPRPGDLVVIDLKGQVVGSGQVFVDTDKKKPLALVVGSKPYSKGLCQGLDYVIRSMKAGGKRRVIVPPALGFGEDGAELESGLQIPPFATLDKYQFCPTCRIDFASQKDVAFSSGCLNHACLGLFLLIRIFNWGQHRHFDEMRANLLSFGLESWFASHLCQCQQLWKVFSACLCYRLDNVGCRVLVRSSADQKKLSFNNCPQNKGRWCDVGI